MSRPARTTQQAAQQVDRAADQLLDWLQQQKAYRRDPHGASDATEHAVLREGKAQDDGAGLDVAEQDQAAPTPERGSVALPSGVSLQGAHTDWLHHRLDVTGPAAMLANFQAAASGAGIIPWSLDRDRMAEDLFHLLVAPPAPQRRRLSLAGARVLAGQLCDAAALRHAVALARVGHSRACAFDLHALVPVPPVILLLGPDYPDSLAWLWRQWAPPQPCAMSRLNPSCCGRLCLPAPQACGSAFGRRTGRRGGRWPRRRRAGPCCALRSP